jgi:hypothetical protein
MGIKKENNYSIIDFRINESNNNKNGILQNVVLLDQKELILYINYRFTLDLPSLWHFL